MEDKKTNTPGNNNQNKTEPKSVAVDLLNLKNPEELKKEAQTQTAEFGSAGTDDINKNVGSFGKTVVQPQEVKTEVKLDVDTKVVEKAAKEKIDFERFKRTKKPEKSAKTKFGEKVSLTLRSKEGLRKTWITELIIMFIITVLACLIVGFFQRWWGYNNLEKIARMQELQGLIKTGLVFSWIAIFPCLIPLIYLLTTWFIGINQVASSRTFHFIFWGFELFALVCLIIGFCLLIPCLDAWINIPAYH